MKVINALLSFAVIFQVVVWIIALGIWGWVALVLLKALAAFARAFG